MSYKVKEFIVFMIVYSAVFQIVDHYVDDKTWALALFGGFAYIYGRAELLLENKLRG